MTLAEFTSRDPLAHALVATAFSLGMSLTAGPAVIRWLRRFAGERIDSASQKLDELHAAKRGTPTMGGILIVGCTGNAIWMVAEHSLPIAMLAIFLLLGLAGIGACDDWLKLRTSRRGLTARQKILGQSIVAVIAATCLHMLEATSADSAPAMDRVTAWLHSGWWFVPWAAFVIVGASNAVNLTDGLDGLAAGTASIASGTLSVIGLSLCGFVGTTSHPHVACAAILAAALCGGTLGFLWFNRYPARVFMGDTGALPIGGILALSALAMRRELLLAIVAGVFVIETVSVFVQVFWYRRTGRRILLCSPLHNHFVFQRVPERRIVAWFWLAAAAGALVAVLIEVAARD